MNIVILVAAALGAMVLVMTLLWLVQRRTGNAGIVDVAWAYGTGAVGACFAAFAPGLPERRWIAGALAAIWALRLGTHLLLRVSREEEDVRYRALREKWGDRAQPLLFGFFMLQASWAVLFALPSLLAAANPTALGIADAGAVLVFLVAVGGETLADRQLARFRRDPANRGRVMRSGLWAWSRHPNYFFEWLGWWAFALLASGYVWGWLGPIAPLAMLFFLLRVTGIPPTEERLLASRGEAYRAYQRETSAFLPLPPRKGGGR